MSRGAFIPTVFVALLVLAAGTGYLLRSRSSASTTQRPPPPTTSASATTISALDPTWCGKPLGPLRPGELGDASDCGKLSLTGSAPECLFWAECREVRFQIDCTAAAGPGRCRCDGESGLTVPYDPAFCSLDSTQPQRSLHAILDAAAVACKWTSPGLK